MLDFTSWSIFLNRGGQEERPKERIAGAVCVIGVVSMSMFPQCWGRARAKERVVSIILMFGIRCLEIVIRV
jgi:hypothetical protein